MASGGAIFTLLLLGTVSILNSKAFGPDPSWPKLKNYTKVETEEAKHIKRILAFGDSITEGYLSNGHLKFFPYSTKLEEMLNRHTKSTRFEVINEGVSGECVYMEMATRLPKLLSMYKHHLDLVIILGGTNDLRKLDCDEKVNVAYELISLHDMVHKKGIKSVVVTIPEADESDTTLTHYTYEKYKQIWQTVNHKLRVYAKKNSNMTLMCDLVKEFPMKKLADKDRQKYWNDHVHPSKHGYQKLAQIFFDVIRKEYNL